MSMVAMSSQVCLGSVALSGDFLYRRMPPLTQDVPRQNVSSHIDCILSYMEKWACFLELH